MLSRHYAPVSYIHQKGSLDLLIKTYRPNDENPVGDTFTNHLEQNVKVGDFVYVKRGPTDDLKYTGCGEFNWNKKPIPHFKSKIGLIAAGTGIAPLLSMAQASIGACDFLDIRFLCSNKRKRDILCKPRLDKLQEETIFLKSYHTLTMHDESVDGHWNGLTGRVNMDMLRRCDFPEPKDDNDILITSCGPKGFTEYVNGFLEENGYKRHKHFW